MAILDTFGVRDGNNLFHSFEVFNVRSGEQAFFVPSTFAADPSVANILSRVTGPGSSEINGTLDSGTFYPAANFFFMNPNGVIFGDQVALNVAGSFHATTGDYIKFADGKMFYADAARNTMLTAAAPSAFGFLSSSSGRITVGNGNFGLQLNPGETFSLVGGPIDVGVAEVAPNVPGPPGILFVPQGRVNLVSVASPGEATLAGGVINTDSITHFDDVNIVAGFFGSVVDAQDVFIRADNFVIDNSIVFPGTFSQLGVSPLQPNGGVIDVKVAGDMSVTGSAPVFGVPAGITSRTGFTDNFTTRADAQDINIDVGGSLLVSGLATIRGERYFFGEGSNITITADSLTVEDGASVGVLNFFSKLPGETPEGSLTVNVNQLELVGDGSAGFTGLTSQSDFHPLYGTNLPSLNPVLTDANGGPLTVNVTNDLIIRNGATINSSSFGFGSSGDLVINASDMMLSRDGAPVGTIGAQSTFAGPSGDLTVNAVRTISLQDGFQITASTAGTGDGGSVTVTAGQSLSLSGTGTGIFSRTTNLPTPALDDFAQNFNQLYMQFFGVTITSWADLMGQFGLPATTTFFDALPVLNASGLTSISDQTPGDGGQISVNAPQVILEAGSIIDSASTTDGLSGDVSIYSSDQVRLADSSISTQATTSDGGNITIQATTLLDLLNSTIETSVESGVGAGGNIDIDPKAVVLQNSRIIANAFGGPGGNIRIVAGQFIVDQTSIVSASSALGIDGRVEINAPDSNITGKLVPLPKDFLDASKLLRDRCGAQRGGTSSFSAKGRGGVPPGPDGYLSSYAMGGAGEQGVATGSARDAIESNEGGTPHLPMLAMAATQCTW
jgi:filamentous hemagglutinin family protein